VIVSQHSNRIVYEIEKAGNLISNKELGNLV